MIDLGNDFDAEESQAGLHTAIARLPKLAAAGTGLLIRVSSAFQRTHSKGSQRYQRDQARFLRDYNATTKNLRVFDARGESARPHAARPVFRDLIDAVRRKEICLVLVSDADRIARNDPDAEELYNALRDIGGLVVINGEIHDPANANHRLVLRLRAVIAQYENEQRAIRSLTSKSAKARDLALAVRLATGLVWASPEDPEFRTRMKAAGLQRLLSPESLASHRTKVDRKGRRMCVFPYPDAGVEKAGRLTVRWFLEEGGIPGLLCRIRTDPEWPRPGEFPAVGSRLFDPEVTEVKWKALCNRKDGRDEMAPGVLRDWLNSPSVYGTYKAIFPKLKKLSLAAHRLGAAVKVADAFPSFAGPDDEQRVRDLLSHPDHPKIRGSWRGARNHALAHVACCHPMPDGRPCNRRMNAMYSSARNGAHRYLSVACGLRGHRFSLPPAVDDVVLDMLRHLFTRESLGADLKRIRADGGAQAAQLRTLEERLGELDGRLNYHAQQGFRANRAEKYDLAEFHEKQVEHFAGQKKECERRLEDLRIRSQRDRALTDQECEEILELASDLPELLRRARPIEGKVREIVRELVRRVRARRLGSHAFFIELELHSGQRISRIFLVAPVKSSEPLRALAHARLAPWLDPAARMHTDGEARARAEARSLAEELNDVLKPHLRTPWTADRVFSAAMSYQARPDPPRSDSLVPVAELAHRLNLAEREVLSAALRGRLGPAAVVDGTLCLDPAVEQVHKTFPDVARRFVAEQTGWPEEDVVTLLQLGADTGWGRYHVQEVARAAAGVVTDKAGRRYTRRRAFPTPAPGDLERILDSAVPGSADRVSGEWVTWAQASRRLPGVNLTTFEHHTSVVRPRFGDNGLRTTYIWIDRHVERRVRKPTLDEALAGLDPEPSPADFIPRREILETLRRRFGSPSLRSWTGAVAKGYVLEVHAQGPTSRRLIAWALVPAEVRDATSYATVQAFLRGEHGGDVPVRAHGPSPNRRAAQATEGTGAP